MRPFSALPILLGALVLGPACYDLPHVDPGPRWIDQFGGYAGVPTWNVFGAWTCGTEPVPIMSDGGGAAPGFADLAPVSAVAADAAVADAGDAGFPRMPCQMGAGDLDNHGLDQPFAFADTSNDVEFTVTTQATSGVDFTGFRAFAFRAWVRGTGTTPLPLGTVFRVELACSQNQVTTILAQTVSGATINGQAWDMPFALDLAGFYLDGTSSDGTTSAGISSAGSCLTQIDAIRFVVRPGQNDLPEVVGTVSLDSVALQH